MSLRTRQLIASAVSGVILGLLILLISGCRTLTDTENKILDREKQKAEEPKIPEVRP